MNDAARTVLPVNLDYLRMKPERASIGGPIGEGSFGVVYDGTYKLYKDRPPVPVAFKRMKLSVRALSQEIMDALTREVCVTSSQTSIEFIAEVRN